MAAAAGELLSSALGDPSSGAEESLRSFRGVREEVPWLSPDASDSAVTFSVFICSKVA